MKRSTALQPLSREHHTALALAKACERAAQSRDENKIAKACQRVIQVFPVELEPHFQIEEQTWLPLLRNTGNQSLEQCTLADHRQLRALLDSLRLNDAGALNDFGKRLAAHVRFEERELFPALESLMQ
jgi:iron-sulfur cluster repair protein YtfE (RIC family)